MTLRRRLGLKISQAVVRRAPPRAREWATAMLRELDHIESDWAALGWALGSVRILFVPCHVPFLEPSQIPLAAQNLAKVVRRRTVIGSATALFEAGCFTWIACIVPTRMQRIASLLVVASMLYSAWQLFARRAREVSGQADAYRAELERQRDFHRGLWFWSRFIVMIPGLLLFCIAGIAARGDQAGINALVGALFIVVLIVAVPLNLRTARGYQVKIDELDAAQAKPES